MDTIIIIQGENFYQTPYEGYYVTIDGKKIASFRKLGMGLSHEFQRFLKYKLDKDGYYEVTLNINKKTYYKKVHQIVAETFLGKPKNLSLVIDHKNSNRTDNHYKNLHYVTVKYNVRKGRLGVKPACAKKIVLNIDGFSIEYNSIKDAMKSIGKCASAYYRMKNNNIGGRFEYKVIKFEENVETKTTYIYLNKIK